MAVALEQKRHLTSLLRIKRGEGTASPILKEELEIAIAPMEQEDVAYVEKIIGVKAL